MLNYQESMVWYIIWQFGVDIYTVMIILLASFLFSYQSVIHFIVHTSVSLEPQTPPKLNFWVPPCWEELCNSKSFVSQLPTHLIPTLPKCWVECCYKNCPIYNYHMVKCMGFFHTACVFYHECYSQPFVVLVHMTLSLILSWDACVVFLAFMFGFL